MKWTWLPAFFLIVLIPRTALAECVSDSRSVPFGESGFAERSYICRTGGAHFRVEYHRLSSDAASFLHSDNRVPALDAIIGAARLERNAVSSTYEDLVARVGYTMDLGEVGSMALYSIVEAPDGSMADDYDGDLSGKVSLMIGASAGYYPAVRELHALRAGGTPDGMKREGDYIWRFLTMDDVRNYASNVTEFNSEFANNYSPYDIYGTSNNNLDLMTHMADGTLPQEYSVLRGHYSEIEPGCVSPGVGWIFEFLPREVAMDALVIENLGAGPLAVSALIGEHSDGALREYTRDTGADNFAGLETPIGAGESVILPTAVVFPPTEDLKPFTSTSYAFGPELDISGVVANGETVSFEERSANFLNLSLSNEIGSCPYLLSWHEGDQEWREHGKILHEANGADLAYEEQQSYRGWRGRFRLEEREPEIAYIDRAALSIELEDGETLELLPDREDLKHADGDHAEFLWHEGIEFSFVLPEGTEADEVKRSTLLVSGHYVRYTALAAARAGQSPMPASFGMPQNASGRNALCIQTEAAKLQP